MNVQAGPANDAEFTRPSNEKGEGAYLQVRVVALAETGSRALQGVRVGPLCVGEQTMARELWPLLTPDDRVVADRLFLSHADLAAVAATGAHAIFRVKSDVDLPVLRVLPDGDYLSRIADPAQAKSLRRKKTAPADIPDIPVRVIECSVSADDDADAVPGELFCLATTLLDHQTCPMAEFPDRCAERWELETAIGWVETLRPSAMKRTQPPTGWSSRRRRRPSARSRVWRRH